jgi:drug/metabolite transporter (DMT)-like permease
MNKILALVILIVCAILIALADAFIKKASISGNYSEALKSPWLYLSVLFYLIQILLVAWLFLYKGSLGVFANVFIVFYSIGSVLLGYLMFAERLGPIQFLGIILGLIGVVLITK